MNRHGSRGCDKETYPSLADITTFNLYSEDLTCNILLLLAHLRPSNVARTFLWPRVAGSVDGKLGASLIRVLYGLMLEQVVIIKVMLYE